MDIDKAEVAAGDVFDNVDKVIMRCQKNDGRSWQCKKEAKEGFLFCDHHIRRSSYNNGTSGNGNILPFNFVVSKKESAAPAKTLAGTRRTRPKAVKKGPNPANPYEFYYYSGFGPKWGRKRGKKGEAADEEEDEEGNNVEAAAENVAAASASASSANTDPQPSSTHDVGNGGQLDYMEDDFDDDEDEDGSEEEGGPRRMRRPVKARSLMSIINVKAQE